MVKLLGYAFSHRYNDKLIASGYEQRISFS